MSTVTVNSVKKRARKKSISDIENIINSLCPDTRDSIKQAWKNELNKKKQARANIVSVDLERYQNMDDEVIAKYKSLRNSAKQRGKDFNLSLTDVKRLISRKTCAYTGIRLTYDGGYCSTKATIDRFDPTLGYVKGNVFTVSAAANALKEHLFESGCYREMGIKQLQRFCKTMTDMGMGK